LDSIEGTFKQGGYYRVDLTEELSLLSLNSLYYNSAFFGDAPFDEAYEQLEWLRETLGQDKNTKRKFLLQQHIPPSAVMGYQGAYA